jgi:hypothetical protein
MTAVKLKESLLRFTQAKVSSLLGLQNVHTIHSSVRGRVGHAHMNTHGKSKEEGPREGQQQERRA